MKKSIIIASIFFLFSLISVSATCMDNPSANIYTGNSGFYGDEQFILKSTCVDDDTLSFAYCDGSNPDIQVVYCDCEAVDGIGRCKGKNGDIFYWLRKHSTYDDFFGYIDSSYVRASVLNWIG